MVLVCPPPSSITRAVLLPLEDPEKKSPDIVFVTWLRCEEAKALKSYSVISSKFHRNSPSRLPERKDI